MIDLEIEVRSEKPKSRQEFFLFHFAMVSWLLRNNYKIMLRSLISFCLTIENIF